jgi:cell division protein ZipA
MLMLYLILLAIAALGFVALTLIAISYYKPKPKRYSVSDHAHDKESEETTIAIHEPVLFAEPENTSTVNSVIDDEDATLASLGFSALDTVQEETHPTTLSTHAPAMTPVEPAEEPTLNQAIKPKVICTAEPIVFYLLASHNRPFTGYELLQALLSADLRFGEKRIFHRHEPVEGENRKILFSVASAIEPGIFDMANIGGFSCPGLCVFMAPQTLDDPASVFELMLETIQQLADDLDGELCNENREPLTDAEIEHHRGTISS